MAQHADLIWPSPLGCAFRLETTLEMSRLQSLDMQHRLTQQQAAQALPAVYSKAGLDAFRQTVYRMRRSGPVVRAELGHAARGGTRALEVGLPSRPSRHGCLLISL